MTKKENINRNRLIWIILVGIVILAWTFVNAYFDWGNGSVIYIIIVLLSILGIWFLPKLGVNIFGIDNNWGTDLLIGIGLGVLLIFLSVINLVGSFIYGTGLVTIRVIGAGIFETAFFFILMIPSIYFLFFKKSENILKYLIVLIIVGCIFAFFHFAVATQQTSQLGANQFGAVSGFFISAVLISLIWGFTLKWTKSALPLIISHMILNAWLLYSSGQLGVAFR